MTFVCVYSDVCMLLIVAFETPDERNFLNVQLSSPDLPTTTAYHVPGVPVCDVHVTLDC